MSDKQPVAVLGCSGHGRSIGEFLAEYGHPVVYLDDMPGNFDIIGGSGLLQDERFLSKYRIVIGIGDNRIRYHFSMVVLKTGGFLWTTRHPKATIAVSATTGTGCQFFPGSIVGSGAKINNFVIVNNKASVAHDCTVRDGAQVADGATLGGGVVVGKRTLIGMQAVVLPKITIGDDCIIGAGAVVTRDIASGSTVKGNPAK